MPIRPPSGWSPPRRSATSRASSTAGRSSPNVTRVCRPGLPRPVAEREPLVYVTFGSEIPGMPMFVPTVTAAVAAARQTGCRVLLSVGSADPGPLGDLTGVEVASWVDQAAVLPRARAVISHAGAGTTLDALAAGTPTIAVPFFADQPLNAEQLAATGTGLAVPPGPELTERLTDALHEVLATEPPGCAPMAAAVHGLPDIGEAVALLERTARASARQNSRGRRSGVGSGGVSSTWFLAVAGVAGDSTVEGHEDELEVSGVDLGVEPTTPYLPVAEPASGRPVLDGRGGHHHLGFGGGTPAGAACCATGRHAQTARLVGVSALAAVSRSPTCATSMQRVLRHLGGPGGR